MSFIKTFLEQETAKRRDFLLASAYGLAGVATAGVLPPQAGLVVGHVSPDYSRILRE